MRGGETKGGGEKSKRTEVRRNLLAETAGFYILGDNGEGGEGEGGGKCKNKRLVTVKAASSKCRDNTTT